MRHTLVYGDEFRNNVLEKIGTKPQMGLPRAREGTQAASRNTVWKCLSKEGIHLERQGTRRVSTDPEFAEKAADIVGPCLNPPESAAAIC